MHSIYAKAKTAREVAEAGVAAGCEFDRNSAAPFDIFTLKLREAK
jgi:ATP-dependent HslUV protease, peptidase subunit HslV